MPLCFCTYPTGPLSPNNLFGSSRRICRDSVFQFQGHASLFSDPSSPERMTIIFQEEELTLRSIISSARFEDLDKVIYNNPAFMFVDAALDTERRFVAEENHSIFKVGGDKLCIPTNIRHFPLAYFMCVTRKRKMLWHLIPRFESVHVGRFTFKRVGRASPPTYSTGLHPNLKGKEVQVVDFHPRQPPLSILLSRLGKTTLPQTS